MDLTIKLFIVLVSTLNIVCSYPATYTNYVGPYQQSNYENTKIFSESDAPQSFESKESPLNSPHKTQEYEDFIKELYRFDKEKVPQLQQQFPSINYQNNPYQQTHRIYKRAIVFRPLFTYRQQTIKKQKVNNNNDYTTQSPSGYVPANKSPTFVDGDNHIYQQYNPYYYPYQYGQIYPYST